jgi:hypothetical protein
MLRQQSWREKGLVFLEPLDERTYADRLIGSRVHPVDGSLIVVYGLRREVVEKTPTLIVATKDGR